MTTARCWLAGEKLVTGKVTAATQRGCVAKAGAPPSPLAPVCSIANISLLHSLPPSKQFNWLHLLFLVVDKTLQAGDRGEDGVSELRVRSSRVCAASALR